MNLKKKILLLWSFSPSWIRIRIPNPDPLTRLNPDPIRIRNSCFLSALRIQMVPYWFGRLDPDPERQRLPPPPPSKKSEETTSVADPVSVPFLTPWSGMRKKLRSGIRIRGEHFGSYFREHYFGLKYLNSLMRMQIRDKHPGPNTGNFMFCSIAGCSLLTVERWSGIETNGDPQHCFR